MVTAFIDYFVPTQFRRDADLLLRVRILVIVLLTLIVQESSVCLVLLARFDREAIVYGGSLTLISVLSSIYFLIRLRSHSDYVFSSAGAALITLTLVCCGIWFSGGVIDSPATQLLPAPALMAFFFGGMGLGALVTGVALFGVFVMLALQHAGIALPRVMETEAQWHQARFLLSAIHFFFVSGLAFAYEFTARQLRRERTREQEVIQQLAKTDPLTGLANRRNFDAALLQRLQQAASGDNTFVLGYLDLDGFKPINDRYGHAVGDEVLRIISDRLRASLRNTEFVGRYGGDEFMLILDVPSAQFDAAQMAARLLTAIEQPISTSKGLLALTGSIGFAVFPQHGRDNETLIQAADLAMYHAKREHAGWCAYRDDLKSAAA